MKTYFSKPSADIAIETAGWQAQDSKLRQSQRAIARNLLDGPARHVCLLCDAALDGASRYLHRQVKYAICGSCGHFQVATQVPDGYPMSCAAAGFEKVYPKLEAAAFASRRDRIYTPKLEWALSSMEQLGISAADALGLTWFEVGCGAGYFLDALRVRDARNFSGIDGSAELVAIASDVCGRGRASVTEDLIADLGASSAQVVVALFVLEHLEEARRFWDVMSRKPSGTVFIFAVPAFGFSSIVEGVFEDFAARNLDSVLHTQLYTDESIDYALDAAGYDKQSEWLFGQDASDLCRILAAKTSTLIEGGQEEQVTKKLSALADSLQSAIDRARLCDARHVLAVKR